MENSIGRMLTDNEEVHHKDHNRYNNDISNLQLVSKEEHRLLHSMERTRAWVELICPACGKHFEKPKNQTFLSKPSYRCTCCSRQCKGIESTTIHLKRGEQIVVREFRKPYISKNINNK